MPCLIEPFASAFHPFSATVVAGAWRNRGSVLGRGMDPLQQPGGDPWMRADASMRTPCTGPCSFYPTPAWTNYRPSAVSSPSSAREGTPQSFVPPRNCAGCAGIPGVTNPVTMPLGGTQSPMTSRPSLPPGTGQVPSVPLAQRGNPSSLGMFGNFTNVSHQMGSQMGYPNDSRGYAFQTQNMSGNQHSAAAMNSEACSQQNSCPGQCAAPTTATSALGFLDQTAAPSAIPQVSSAFEMLGKTPASVSNVAGMSNEETMMKALIAALSGDRKLLPSWNGSVETLRGWLRQLSLWELDNNLPKSRWGLKLLQSVSDGSAPRKIAETIDIHVLTSDAGYGAILSAILAKYAPFLEAAGPAYRWKPFSMDVSV